MNNDRISQIIHESMKTAAAEIKRIHVHFNPYHSDTCGIQERNLTHAFSRAWVQDNTGFQVFHEMPLNKPGTDGSWRFQKEHLDTVIWSNDIVVYIEAKQLYRKKSVVEMSKDWTRLSKQAGPSFRKWLLDHPLKRNATEVRILLADYWSGADKDTVVIPWWESKGENALPRHLSAMNDNSHWWQNGQSQPAADLAHVEPIHGISASDAKLRNGWETYRTHYLLAAWNIAAFSPS